MSMDFAKAVGEGDGTIKAQTALIRQMLGALKSTDDVYRMTHDIIIWDEDIEKAILAAEEFLKGKP